ncbi:transglycosylase [Carboxydothermus hydrogenoformans Z-2901]|uniref:Transglycosylase n=1 Tax=Carboxydothermus hydrogenoformans (strain ATCC BAA-161 / DSM 6008 / Z-2901) TaxID=246194 RepID=Q3ABX0_CARHZ|nr:lytic transglycosylase domain-containing protein [Carboxydothermus hydrogenoformans]ABB15055.1 transglycosylase [Carboxydothermus hydrogenoformans Z-2901]
MKPVLNFPMGRPFNRLWKKVKGIFLELTKVVGIILLLIIIFLYFTPAKLEDMLIMKIANYNPPYSVVPKEFKLDKKATLSFKKEKYYEFKKGLKDTIAFLGHELTNFNRKDRSNFDLSSGVIVKSNLKNALTAFADFLTMRIYISGDRQKVAVGSRNFMEYIDQKHRVLRWSKYIFKAAELYNLDPALIAAVIEQESGGNPNAISPAGAIGLMQLMPKTARGLGVDPYDPEQNIIGGARYLAIQYKRFGNWQLALAAYNAGPGNVYNNNYLYISETQNYIRKVPLLMEKYRAIFANAKINADEAKEDENAD